MRFILIFVLILLFPLFISAQQVHVITIDGSINPASAEFIKRSIKKAEKENAAALVIRLNTPGGLLKSTRIIVGAILDADVPVIVYVAPSGAHSGSAGVFITLAAHIAAMAPGTNIGAAHPVVMQASMDSVMNEKATNDAAAFIRTISEKRKRNVEWAEEAVRKSVSITASDALEKNVIDIIAINLNDLLQKIDGKAVELVSGNAILRTNKREVKELEMGFVEKILNILSDPNIAYMLMLLGFYGVLFELYNPGAILPGIIGVISLVLAFYSLHTLPVNYAGLALILFGIILFILEANIVSHGVLGIGGTVSLLIGSLMLIRNDANIDVVRISRVVIIASTVVTALFFFFIIGYGLKAQRTKPVTGFKAIVGEQAEALDSLDPRGTVRFQGEIWQAESIAGPIDAGSRIRVTGIKDLLLFVEPFKNNT